MRSARDRMYMEEESGLKTKSWGAANTGGKC